MSEQSDNHADEMREEDWKVLFSFGFAKRYVPAEEITREGAYFSAIRLYKRGLLDYFRGNGTTNDCYGINQDGADLLERHLNRMPKDLLFGARV